ncbi:MAG: ABC transporter permease [Candidatus Manganitrophus sp.]|nr:ABC transporter permease [Candidatus Manganitrophus sp.]
MKDKETAVVSEPLSVPQAADTRMEPPSRPNLLAAVGSHRPARIGGIGLAVIVLLSLVGPLLWGEEPGTTRLDRVYASPSFTHPFGTDQLGRDLFVRVLHGGRISLLTGLTATLMATIVGVLYGLLSGMARRWADLLMMQLLDALLSIPVLLLVIVSQAFGRPSFWRVIVVIGLAGWMGTARVVRTECRRWMQADFIKAAIASGTTPIGLVTRHLLPNILAPLIVVMTVGVGQAILLESTLSFLNLGVPMTLPSWGNLLGNGMSNALTGAWWTVLFPGVMIVLTVLAINLVGDGLRDAVDPKTRGILQ